MNIVKTTIEDLLILEPRVFGDDRGFFMETFRDSFFRSELGLDVDFVQDNHSASSKGVLRGLHYQIQKPQGKLVRVISGSVYDVAVDIRKSSPTFGQYVGVELSASNKKIFWVPAGFAHGFSVMSEHAEFVYKCTEYYAPELERCLLWNDSQVNIDWPLSDSPLLSEKDERGKLLKDAECFD